mgnify:CR=1 FL=1
MITLRGYPLLAGLLMLLGCFPVAMATAAEATGEPQALPRPAALEPAVAFWTRIYTEVPVDRGLIHDAGLGLRVYGEVAVAPPGEWRTRREQVRTALKTYRAAFESLAANSLRAQTALEARLLARLPAGTRAADLPAIAERLRFQGGLRERFRAGLERSGRWRDDIRRVFAAAGIPQALTALPHVESSFNPQARSHAGAAGLWQFTVGTGREFMRVDRVVDERLDPWLSTRAAARLLAQNHAELGSWPLAITAYNHGRYGMKRAVAAVGSRDYVRIRETYDGPRFGFASRNFYPALLAAAAVDANARRYFADLQRDPPQRPVRVVLPHYTPVDTLLAAVDVSAATLQRLNPSLGPAVWDGRKFIPRGHALALPAVDSDWQTVIAGLPGTGLYRDQRPDQAHAVAAGETLSGIAARYGVQLETLMARNGIRNANRIRAGQQLVLPAAGAMPATVGGRHYEVRPGDTLSEIAQRHGLDRRRLERMNALSDPDRLQVGQRLVIAEAPQVAVADTEPEP